MINLFSEDTYYTRLFPITFTIKMDEKKKLRLRFTYEDDLILLREFINNNPIRNEEGWQQIQNNVFVLTKKEFTIRTLKQHLLLLLEFFLKKAKLEEVRSGIEVPCNEKDNLLEEVSSMCKEANYTIKPTRKKAGLTKDQQLCLLGKDIRKKYAESFYSLDEQSEGNTKENKKKQPTLHKFGEHDYVMLDDIDDVEEIEVSEMESSSMYDNPQPGTSQWKADEPSLISNNTPSKISKNSEMTKSTTESTTKEDPKNSEGSVAKNVLVPTRKRRQREPVRKNALSYLSNKHENDLEVKKKEIALENRKLDLEEKKIKLDERRIALQEKQCEIEHKERVEKLHLEKKKVEIELHEKQVTQQLLQCQQIIINRFLKEHNEQKVPMEHTRTAYLICRSDTSLKK